MAFSACAAQLPVANGTEQAHNHTARTNQATAADAGTPKNIATDNSPGKAQLKRPKKAA
ncbi:Uu.00g134430.m01.CDS01 [Anthostomella pinea]|uniref:Uu.00g134430.m01.CDS01 n=1 Tax=Anthostomella pinea TaxID=933095 RepID=A0AAI8YKU4_9PEZI|nr:Uu.00g134430.m01.CDS01 [Anthostomella pinea]